MWYNQHIQLRTGCIISLVRHSFSTLTKSPSWALTATYMSLQGKVSPTYAGHDHHLNQWACWLCSHIQYAHVSQALILGQSPSTEKPGFTCKTRHDLLTKQHVWQKQQSCLYSYWSVAAPISADMQQQLFVLNRQACRQLIAIVCTQLGTSMHLKL